MTSKRLCLPLRGWFSIRRIWEHNDIFHSAATSWDISKPLGGRRGDKKKTEMNCCGRWLGNYTEPKSAVQKGGVYSHGELCRRNENSSESRIKGPIQSFMHPDTAAKNCVFFFVFFFLFVWMKIKGSAQEKLQNALCVSGESQRADK